MATGLTDPDPIPEERDPRYSWKRGDFNGDTDVNDKDAAILAANWGKAASLPTPPNNTVPEPSTWCLLAGALAMLAVWRRKSR
jgi:hypothetical protein